MTPSPLQQAFFLTAITFSLSTLASEASFASCPHCAQHSSPVVEELDQGQAYARTVFPPQEERYTFERFAERMKPVVSESLWSDFKNGWRTVMAADDTVPHLPVADEIGHIQCLYGKLWTSKNSKEDGWVAKQTADIYTALNHPTHMKLIRAADKNLAHKITQFFQNPVR